jgi:hypothetical protein
LSFAVLEKSLKDLKLNPLKRSSELSEEDFCERKNIFLTWSQKSL